MSFKFCTFFKSLSLVSKCPQKRHHTTSSFLQSTVLSVLEILFICVPFTGKGFMLEKLGLSLERQRLNMSKLERCKTVKALNRIMMNVFP